MFTGSVYLQMSKGGTNKRLVRILGPGGKTQEGVLRKAVCKEGSSASRRRKPADVPTFIFLLPLKQTESVVAFNNTHLFP